MKYKEINSLNVADSMFWKMFESTAAQIIQLIVAIIIARILNPEEYGIIAIISIFITFASILVQGGISTALIQKKDADDLDFSTLFFMSLIISILVYIFLYISSPFISSFFGLNQLTITLRIMSLGLFPGVFLSIQNAIIARSMNFKKSFISNMTAIAASGFLGITMAIRGYGVWALITQQLTFKLVLSFSLFLTLRWKPSLQFSYIRCKKLFSFGSNILLANLIDAIYTNLQSLAIGKIYTPSVLAFYTKGKQFPLLLIDNLNGSIQSVMLPTLASSQDDRFRLKQMLRKSLMISTYIVFPAMIGMAAVSEPFILLILGEKWKSAIIYMRIYAFTTMIFPLITSNLLVFNALGYSRMYLKFMTFKRLTGILILLVSILLIKNIYFFIFIGFVVEVAALYYSMTSTYKLIDYKVSDQLIDLLPNFILSLIMGGMIYWISLSNFSNELKLSLQLIIGTSFFIYASYKFKFESYEFVYNFIRMKLKKILS